MKNLTFHQKLWLPLLFGLLALTLLSVFSAFQARAIRIEERKHDLVSVTTQAVNLAKQYDDLVRSGAMSKEDAQKQALDRFRPMRYDKDGYFTITDSEERVIMHPIKAELVGKKQSDFKDAAGKRLYVEMTAASKHPDGDFVSYVWPHVGGTESVPTLAYVLRYEPWDWIFSTGAYMDDINVAFMQSLYQTAGLLAVVGVVLALLAGVAIRSLERTRGGDPAYAAEVVNRIAGGDLTVEIHTRSDNRDSLLSALARMCSELAQTMGRIRLASETMGGAAREIASGNLDLSSRTEQQASSLEETAASMEQMTATVKQNADNARQAHGLVADASSIAAKGGEVVSRVVQTMDSISASASKITDIIGVIDGIAFQTNILALNAAVEAARAGEQGRGFAVVAGEVRSLAQRSAGAAKEIKALIEASVGQVNAGHSLVGEAGATMAEVVGAVGRVTNLMGEITSASDEQSAGIQQVNIAVAQMDQMTQQNAALVEEAAAAAESLQNRAGELAESIAFFRIDGSGASPAAVS